MNEEEFYSIDDFGEKLASLADEALQYGVHARVILQTEGPLSECVQSVCSSRRSGIVSDIAPRYRSPALPATARGTGRLSVE